MTERAAVVALALVNIAEAQHALDSARVVLERAKRGAPHDMNEAATHISTGTQRAETARWIVAKLAGHAEPAPATREADRPVTDDPAYDAAMNALHDASGESHAWDIAFAPEALQGRLQRAFQILGAAILAERAKRSEPVTEGEPK